MSAGPLRTAFVAGLATVGAAIGPLTGNAVAQEAQPIQINASTEASAMIRAGNFSEQDRNNVAIMMYYGLGNRTPPERAGEMLVEAIEDAGDRANFPVDAEYFFMRVDNFEGIAIDFAMGGVSIEGVDVRAALERPSPQNPVVVADRVVQKRIDVNRVLEMASLNYQ